MHNQPTFAWLLTNFRLSGTLCLALLITACGSGLAHKDSEPEEPAGPAAAVNTKLYPGVGIVRGMDLKRPSIEIAHEEIKGLMPAMQMEFYVKDQSLLNGLSVGDQIDFTIESRAGGLQISAIRKR